MLLIGLLGSERAGTSCAHLFLSALQSLMDQYFARMRSLMNNKELPARIRFLLQDTVELRENNWVPRKAFIDNGPKTINQIRQDAVKVCQVGGVRLWLGLKAKC